MQGRRHPSSFAVQRRPESENTGCRRALVHLAQIRHDALAEAERAGLGIAEILPQALQAGVSVVDVARLTGLSRPTLYRMLSEAREQQPLRELSAEFELALERHEQALPYELSESLGISVDEVFDHLMRLYPLVTEEFSSLGEAALTSLVDFLPELGVPERIVLAMLMLQRLSTDRVAVSTRLPEVQVLGWAALGLLRMLPRIREALSSPARVAQAHSHSSDRASPRLTSIDRRYRVGDPRRHRSFDIR
jgi:hypothetical protein